LLTLLDTVRYQPIADTRFCAGNVLLAAAGVLQVKALRSSGTDLRCGGLALGAGLVLFLPQFFGPAPLRMAHGVLLGLGCVLVAVAAWRRLEAPGQTESSEAHPENVTLVSTPKRD
ncbi:MAG: hypothetical protein ABWX96_18365, partial [Propionibacteriaceae bacterium]